MIEISNKQTTAIYIDKEFIVNAIKEKIEKDEEIKLHPDCPIKFDHGQQEAEDRLSGANITFIKDCPL